MSARKIIQLGILAALLVAATLFFQFRSPDKSAVNARILQLVHAFDDAVFVSNDYEAAEAAATEIVDLADESNNPDATQVRGLIRLSYLEIESGNFGNHWQKKIERCKMLVSKEPTIDRGEFLYYLGIIEGKWQKKYDEGLGLIQEAIWISKHTNDDRTLALSHMSLSELYKVLEQPNLVTENAYRAVTIAQHHSQKSVELRTLRNLAGELMYLGNYDEAVQCGKEVLSIKPNAQDGMFMTFLGGESDAYLEFVNDELENVQKLESEGLATNSQFMRLGRLLNKLANAFAIRNKYAKCKRYSKLSMSYAERADDQTTLKDSSELFLTSKLNLVREEAEIDAVAETFEGEPGEILMNALASNYSIFGAIEKYNYWRERAVESARKRKTDELGFLKQSSELFWEAEIDSRKQIKISDQMAATSQRRVSLLSTALISGLTVCGLLSGFYLLLHRERNSLENTVEARTESLAKAMEDANAADQAKSEFLSRINHEIRNPLTAILGYCDLLSLNKKDSLQYVAGIESSSLHLRELVDKILEVSKIESSGLTLKCHDFVPAQTASDISDIMAEQAAKKGLQFECSFHGDETCSIYSDETKIRQIALNLIGNAIKFTEHGSIKVSFELNKNDSCLTTIVTDTGIGIAQQEAAAVFERFSKASNSVTCEGSGLGLFITSQLVKCLAGEITLDSELGQGSQVTVLLPVQFTSDSTSSS